METTAPQSSEPKEWFTPPLAIPPLFTTDGIELLKSKRTGITWNFMNSMGEAQHPHFSTARSIFILEHVKNFELLNTEASWMARDGLLPLLWFFNIHREPPKGFKSRFWIHENSFPWIPDAWKKQCNPYRIENIPSTNKVNEQANRKRLLLLGATSPSFCSIYHLTTILDRIRNAYKGKLENLETILCSIPLHFQGYYFKDYTQFHQSFIKEVFQAFSGKIEFIPENKLDEIDSFLDYEVIELNEGLYYHYSFLVYQVLSKGGFLNPLNKTTLPRKSSNISKETPLSLFHKVVVEKSQSPMDKSSVVKSNLDAKREHFFKHPDLHPDYFSFNPCDLSLPWTKNFHQYIASTKHLEVEPQNFRPFTPPPESTDKGKNLNQAINFPMKSYYSPVPTALSLNLTSETLKGTQKNCSNEFILRDGLVPSLWFFENNPAPVNKKLKLFIHPDLAPYVPKTWRNNLGVYSIEEIPNPSTPGKVLFTGVIHPGYCSLECIESNVKRLKQLAKQRNLDANSVDCFFTLSYDIYNFQPENDFTPTFIEKLTRLLHPLKANFISEDQFNSVSSFHDYFLFEANEGLLLKDSYTFHYPLSRGAKILETRGLKLKGEFIPLSLFHGVRLQNLLPSTNQKGQKSQQEASSLSDQIRFIRKNLDMPEVEDWVPPHMALPWPSWFQHLIFQHARD